MFNLIAILSMLLLPDPGVPPDAELRFIESPGIASSGWPISGYACRPEWGGDCDRPIAAVTLTDWPQFLCDVEHESLHLALGPDPDGETADAYWREAAIYDETRRVVGPWCPAYGQ